MDQNQDKKLADEIVEYVKTTSYQVGYARKESHWIEVPPKFKGKKVVVSITEVV